jgi:glycosyltransferase involved in cell wall biosynthesis
VRRPCIPSKNLEAITHSAVCSIESGLRGYDVVHFHGVGPCLAIPLAKLPHRSAICATIHDQDYKKQKWAGFARRMLRAGEATACRYSDGVISVARYIQDDLRDSYGREVDYIPNGNDPLPVQPPGETLAQHGLEAGRYLMFLARLVPEKGCDVLIRALRASDSQYRLAIVGGASHSDQYVAALRELAAGDERITFLGFQSGDAQEGLPLSLLEMLWHGMPVIASDIPAVHEVDGAVPAERVELVPPGDERALREAIERLPWPGRAGTPGDLRWPTWADVAEQVETVYQGLRR